MALPGFSAEASIGPTKQIYRVQDRHGTAQAAFAYPQAMDDEWSGGLSDEDLGTDGFEEEEAMEMAGDEEDIGDDDLA